MFFEKLYAFCKNIPFIHDKRPLNARSMPRHTKYNIDVNIIRMKFNSITTEIIHLKLAKIEAFKLHAESII